MKLVSLLLYLVSFIYSNRSVSIPYELLNGKIFITLRIGTPIQAVSRQLDLTTGLSWIVPMYYHKEKSITYNSLSNNTIVLNAPLNAELISDNVILEYEYSITSFLFYLIEFDEIRNLNIEDSFGFGYNMKNDSFSIVHLLYNNDIIKRKAFYIRQWNEQSGYVFFGDINDKELMKKPYRAFCNVNIKYNTWGCDVFSIQIDNRYTYYISSNESYLYFDSGLREIYFPYNSFRFLYDIMNKYESCSIEKYYSTQSIKCPKKLIEQLNSVKMNINGYLIELKLKDIFYCGIYKECRSTINYSDSYKDSFVFGTSIFSSYIVEFNYDESIIGLYSENKFQYIGKKKYYRKYIVLFNSVFLMLFIILNCIVLYK